MSVGSVFSSCFTVREAVVSSVSSIKPQCYIRHATREEKHSLGYDSNALVLRFRLLAFDHDAVSNNDLVQTNRIAVILSTFFWGSRPSHGLYEKLKQKSRPMRLLSNLAKVGRRIPLAVVRFDE